MIEWKIQEKHYSTCTMSSFWNKRCPHQSSTLWNDTRRATRHTWHLAYVGADSLILKFEFWINRGNNVIQMTLYVPISVIGCGRRSQIYWCIVLNLLKLCTSLSYLSSPIRTTEYITCIYRVYPLISWFRKVKSIFMNSSKSVHCKLVHSCGQFLIY